jgi:hypothetical protein
VVAVPRAIHLVFCQELGERVCYLRNGDQTVVVHPPLLADLTLGRRERPVIAFEVAFSPRQVDDRRPQVQLTSSLWNEGLRAIASHVVGCVSYGTALRPIGRAIRRHVDIVAAGQEFASLVPAAAIQYTENAVPPFGASEGSLGLLLPSAPAGQLLVARAVAFLVADGDLPRLAQIYVVAREGHVLEQRAEALAPGSRGVVSLDARKN